MVIFQVLGFFWLNPSLVGSLVILPDKLILGIVDIGCGVCAVAYGENVAVGIVSVAVGHIVAAAGGTQAGDLACGGGIRGGAVGNGVRQQDYCF